LNMFDRFSTETLAKVQTGARRRSREVQADTRRRSGEEFARAHQRNGFGMAFAYNEFCVTFWTWEIECIPIMTVWKWRASPF
jgi:hypothetical protein